MKKYVYIILVLLFVGIILSTAGCISNTTTSTQTAAPTQTVTPTQTISSLEKIAVSNEMMKFIGRTSEICILDDLNIKQEGESVTISYDFTISTSLKETITISGKYASNKLRIYTLQYINYYSEPSFTDVYDYTDNPYSMTYTSNGILESGDIDKYVFTRYDANGKEISISDYLNSK